ncbi:MAG: hypothetical protein OSB19_12355 [Opitutaceae bacterium]|nr:hypothetical protein [Opitutaceae bacterium]
MKSYPLSGERYPVSACHWTTPILGTLDAFSSISDKDPHPSTGWIQSDAY